MSAIELGQKYRDTISGFTGTATSRHEYLYGCIRVGLTGLSVDGRAPEELLFDEQSIETVQGEKPTPTAKAGGSRPAPPRTGMR